VSLDTFAAEIVDRVASRVFARSPFEYGHEAESPLLDAGTFVWTVLQPARAAAVLLPPQATSSDAAATSRTVLSVMRLFVLALISFSS
jgi:hypothetical protein